jgi:hypothetical protein
VSKKIEKLIKSRKSEKKSKKPNREKKPIKPIKILKNRLVRFGFGFISLKSKKPNQTKPKPKKTRKTEPKPRKPSQTGKIEANRFEPVSVRFFFNLI